jgi:DNA polymerase alpha subunit A
VRNEIDFHKVPEYFSKSDDLLRLIAHNENDSYLTLCLTFKLMILPLTKQLTTLAGNLWSRSLLSARAEVFNRRADRCVPLPVLCRPNS